MKKFNIENLKIYITLTNSDIDFLNILYDKQYIDQVLYTRFTQKLKDFIVDYNHLDTLVTDIILMKEQYMFFSFPITNRYFKYIYIYIHNIHLKEINIVRLIEDILYEYEQCEEEEDSLFSVIPHSKIFHSSMFQDLLIQQTDVNEKLLIAPQDIANEEEISKKLTNAYLDQVIIMDLETIGNSVEDNIRNVGKQEPFIRGYLIMNREVLQACIDGILTFDNLWELYKHFKYKNVHSDSNITFDSFTWLHEISDEKLKKKICSFLKKIKIIDCRNKDEYDKHQDILFPFLYHEILLHSKTYIYTFNGKNFDHFIILKDLLEADASIKIKNIIKVNNQLYTLTVIRKNFERENQLRRFLWDYDKATDKTKVLNSRTQKFYKDIDIKTFLKTQEQCNTKYDYLNITIIFRDITTLTGPVSLKNMYNACCDNKDFNKQDFDIIAYINKIKNDTITAIEMMDIYKYCFGDLIATAIIVYLLHTEIIKTFNISPVLNFTAGLISMSLFQQHISKSNINIYRTENNFVNHIIYRSIYGGRVLCYKPLFNINIPDAIKQEIQSEIFKQSLVCKYSHNISNFSNKDFLKIIAEHINNIIQEIETFNLKHTQNSLNNTLFELDVNSLYPAAMANFQYPIGPKKFVYIDINNIQQLLKTECFFICYVKFNTSKIDTTKFLYLPNHTFDKGLRKNYFNNGQLSGIFTSIDIKECISLGYIILEISGGIIWEQTSNIFSEVIQQCYNVRINPESNKALKCIMKICMNSLYGKCAQKPYFKYEDIIPNEEVSKFISKLKNKRNIKLFSTTNKHTQIIYVKEHQCYKYPVELASFILAYSRKIMNFYITKIQEHTQLYYSDTDSLYVNQEGYNILKQQNYIHNTDLGLLKLVNIIHSGLFLGNKIKAIQYYDKCNPTLIKEKITFKGFKYIDFNFVIITFIINVMKQRVTDMPGHMLNILDSIITKEVDVWRKNQPDGIDIDMQYKTPQTFGPFNSIVDILNNCYIKHF